MKNKKKKLLFPNEMPLSFVELTIFRKPLVSNLSVDSRFTDVCFCILLRYDYHMISRKPDNIYHLTTVMCPLALVEEGYVERLP